MDTPLLTIGAFAHAVGLTASALRHYDECGLLRPAEVDDATGYRYYTPDLAERARLVAQLRTAGMSIDSMRAVLDGPPDTGRRALQEFLAEQEARSARTAAVVAEVLAAIDATPATAAPAPALVRLRGPELASALRQVRPAADLDPASPLSGILLDLVPGSLDVVATNRYWMADRTLPIDNPASPAGEARAVLGRGPAAQLATRLDAYDTVELMICAEQIALDGQVVAALPGPYPAHRILLAGLDPASTRAVLDRSELLAAIEAVGAAEVTVTMSADSACVRGSADSTGSTAAGTTDQPSQQVAGTVTGPRVSVRLGSALSRRAVGATVGPEVQLAVGDAQRPIRITAPSQPGFLALLMPVADS